MLMFFSSQIASTVKCVNILELHPEWGGEARRLRLGPLQGNANDILSKYDHINPWSWKGDVCVNQVQNQPDVDDLGSLLLVVGMSVKRLMYSRVQNFVPLLQLCMST